MSGSGFALCLMVQLPGCDGADSPRVGALHPLCKYAEEGLPFKEQGVFCRRG